jgi:ribosomal-protein-alanine N-acetyltransferase
MDLVITPMRRRHLRSIVRIQAADPHLGWSVGLWIAELRREDDRVYVVAQVGRETVGYGGLLLQGEDAHVTTIGVAAAWQQQAIATRMLLHLVRVARERGAQHLTLEVRSSNEAAIALYRRFGLAPAGIRKNYYADLGEDALIMWAHDIDGDAYGDRLDTIDRQLHERAAAAEERRGTDHE